jgi:acyl-CoA thioesterase-1
LLGRNDDRLFPEFHRRDLSNRGRTVLEHRARSGARVDGLAAQARAVRPAEHAVALITIGGNDLLGGLAMSQGRGLMDFEQSLDQVVRDLPIRPVLMGNVYDPTFGDDTAAAQFLSVNLALARANLRRMNEVLASLAAKYGQLVDLHSHFLRGDRAWLTSVIEPSLSGASEVRRCFLPHFGL